MGKKKTKRAASAKGKQRAITRSKTEPKGEQRTKSKPRAKAKPKTEQPEKSKPPKHTRKPTASEQISRELAARALEKRRRGETPNSQELAALKRFERQEEERQRWEFYRTIPQKHWREMSGRQAKVLKEQAELYGIPFGDREIDLPSVVQALHDFLARNARLLANAGEENQDADPLLVGSGSPALEEYRRERTRLVKLEREEREKTLLPRDLVHEGLGRIATILREAGETLQRQFGSDAHQLLNEALDDCQREIGAMVSADDIKLDSDSSR